MFSQLLSNPDYFDEVRGLIYRELAFPSSVHECRAAVFNLERMDHTKHAKSDMDRGLLHHVILNTCNNSLSNGLKSWGQFAVMIQY